MNSKKILCFVLIVVAVILGLFALVSLPKIIGLFAGLFYVVSGKMDAYTIGTIIGGLIYWVVHFWAIIASVNYARKHLRTQSINKNEKESE